MRKIIKMMGILLGGIIVGALLLVIVYMIPVTQDSVHALKSVDVLDVEGWYPTLPVIEEFDGIMTHINKGGDIGQFYGFHNGFSSDDGCRGTPVISVNDYEK